MRFVASVLAAGAACVAAAPATAATFVVIEGGGEGVTFRQECINGCLGSVSSSQTVAMAFTVVLRDGDGFGNTAGSTFFSYQTAFGPPAVNETRISVFGQGPNINTGGFGTGTLEVIRSLRGLYTSTRGPIQFTTRIVEADAMETGLVSFATTAVPETGTWAMMIAGFGLAGGALRRRATVAQA